MMAAPQRVKTMTKADVHERATVARSYLDTAAQRLADALPVGPSAHATVAAGNAVHAGIAASDAICGQVLGHCYNGPDHSQATTILKGVKDGTRLAAELARLLSQKTAADYGGYLTAAVATDMVARARRLVEAMATYGV